MTSSRKARRRGQGAAALRSDAHLGADTIRGQRAPRAAAAGPTAPPSAASTGTSRHDVQARTLEEGAGAHHRLEPCRRAPDKRTHTHTENSILTLHSQKRVNMSVSPISR